MLRTMIQKNEKSCPTCENSLEDHTNEQLQQCALNQLSKINRKLGENTLD
jgi:hypothetical protein